MEVRSRLLAIEAAERNCPDSSSSRIANNMTSTGIMEAISEGDRPAVARSAASANFAASRTVALFGVPFLTAAGLMARGHGVDPSILPKRRRRRVEAILSQAARECSR